MEMVSPFLHAEFLDDRLMNLVGHESDMRHAILDDYDFSHFISPSFTGLVDLYHYLHVLPQRHPKIDPLTPLRVASVPTQVRVCPSFLFFGR